MRVVVYFLLVVMMVFIPISFAPKKVVQIAPPKSNIVKVTLQSPPKEEKPQPKIEKKEALKKKPIVKKKAKPVEQKVIRQKFSQPQPIQEIFYEIPKEPEIESKPAVSQSVVPVQAPSSTPKKSSVEDAYYAKLYDTINQNKKYPLKALKLRQEDSINVSFSVLKNGEIINFKILKESQFSSLNNEVKRMFEKIKVFEKIPQELQAPLEVEITINFQLK